jgi:hypothetical protein
MGKGSRARPLSVPLEEFGSSYDTIFGKKEPKPRWVPPPVVVQETPKQKITFGEGNTMQVRVQEDKDKIGSCGCGRSPTGKCIGWHGLSEEAFQARLEEFKAQQEAANK